MWDEGQTMEEFLEEELARWKRDWLIVDYDEIKVEDDGEPGPSPR